MSAKGIIVQSMPKSWTKWQRINDDMSEEQKQKIKFENSLLIEKRPYFMRYLYGRYNTEYKNYVETFNLLCKNKFKCSLENITEEVKNNPKFIKLKARYDRFNKFLTTDGVMNKVCHYMEQRCKDIKFKLKNNKENDYVKLYMGKTFEIDNEKLKLMVDKYNDYMARRNKKNILEEEDMSLERYCSNLRNEIYEISIDIKELATLAVYVCYILNPNKPKDFAWDVCGEGIVENIMDNTNGQTIYIPRLNENGDIKYLGKRYSIESKEIGVDSYDI